MARCDRVGLAQFLNDYPKMVVRPASTSSLALAGVFEFIGCPDNRPEICDAYEVQIEVSPVFPKELPVVSEQGGKIPRNGEYHVNPDGSLCLGSPLRLLSVLSGQPHLTGFAELCLVPYLYAVSYKLRNGGRFVFGDLPHGHVGIFADYKRLFGVRSNWHVGQMLRALSIPRHVANRRVCPCGCGKSLKQCGFRKVVNTYRKLATRAWYLRHAASLGTMRKRGRRGKRNTG